MEIVKTTTNINFDKPLDSRAAMIYLRKCCIRGFFFPKTMSSKAKFQFKKENKILNI